MRETLRVPQQMAVESESMIDMSQEMML